MAHRRVVEFGEWLLENGKSEGTASTCSGSLRAVFGLFGEAIESGLIDRQILARYVSSFTTKGGSNFIYAWKKYLKFAKDRYNLDLPSIETIDLRKYRAEHLPHEAMEVIVKYFSAKTLSQMKWNDVVHSADGKTTIRVGEKTESFTSPELIAAFEAVRRWHPDPNDFEWAVWPKAHDIKDAMSSKAIIGILRQWREDQLTDGEKRQAEITRCLEFLAENMRYVDTTVLRALHADFGEILSKRVQRSGSMNGLFENSDESTDDSDEDSSTDADA